MVRISAETWNNAGFPALQIHEDNDVLLLLLLYYYFVFLT